MSYFFNADADDRLHQLCRDTPGSVGLAHLETPIFRAACQAYKERRNFAEREDIRYIDCAKPPSQILVMAVEKK